MESHNLFIKYIGSNLPKNMGVTACTTIVLSVPLWLASTVLSYSYSGIQAAIFPSAALLSAAIIISAAVLAGYAYLAVNDNINDTYAKVEKWVEKIYDYTSTASQCFVKN